MIGIVDNIGHEISTWDVLNIIPNSDMLQTIHIFLSSSRLNAPCFALLFHLLKYLIFRFKLDLFSVDNGCAFNIT
jgi:hypothetical protein